MEGYELSHEMDEETNWPNEEGNDFGTGPALV
jgi:hypothetical protein